MTLEEQALDVGIIIISVDRNLNTEMTIIKYTHMGIPMEVKIASSEIKSYDDAYKLLLSK